MKSLTKTVEWRYLPRTAKWVARNSQGYLVAIQKSDASVATTARGCSDHYIYTLRNGSDFVGQYSSMKAAKAAGEKFTLTK